MGKYEPKEFEVFIHDDWNEVPYGEYYNKEEVDKALIELRKEIIEVKALLDLLN